MAMGLSRREFVALTGAGLATAILHRALGQTLSTTTIAAKPPNIILIFGEGQGWTSTSVQLDDANAASKSTLFRTPNLERLAREGVRFANCYAPSPRCTPSRAALLTGQNPATLHMTSIPEPGIDLSDPSRKLVTPRPLLELPAAEVTIPQLLKTTGYATAHFGKWHLGRVRPEKHGFDESDGPNDNDGPDRDGHPNPKQAFAITDLGTKFMERQVKAGKPFYLQLSHYPGREPADTLGKTYEMWMKTHPEMRPRELATASINEDMDTTIGTVLKKIDDLGIADNTYIIYSADHGSGGPRANAPLAGGKGTLMDGGLRVLLLISGPGAKAGLCVHERVTLCDFLPTFAELVNKSDALPKTVEGGSFLQLLAKDTPVKRPREDFVFHFPHYDRDYDDTGPASAIILGNYKMIRFYDGPRLVLFDLSKDPAEQHDLAKTLPDKAHELEQKLDSSLKAANAQVPTTNANYRPDAPVPPRKGR